VEIAGLALHLFLCLQEAQHVVGLIGQPLARIVEAVALTITNVLLASNASKICLLAEQPLVLILLLLLVLILLLLLVLILLPLLAQPDAVLTGLQQMVVVEDPVTLTTIVLLDKPASRI
jgi:hypothetical protein